MSLEVPAESVGTVAGAQSWRQRCPNSRRCDREALLISEIKMLDQQTDKATSVPLFSNRMRKSSEVLWYVSADPLSPRHLWL